MLVKIHNLFLCSTHNVRRYKLAILWFTYGILWWVCLCTNHILCEFILTIIINFLFQIISEKKKKLMLMFLLIQNFHVLSFLASCGLYCTNLKCLAYLGQLIGLVEYINTFLKKKKICISKTKFFSSSFISLQICIILGVLLMVLASIGALRQIILQAKSYTFYS